MKKNAFHSIVAIHTVLALTLALLLGGTPIANAKEFYPNLKQHPNHRKLQFLGYNSIYSLGASIPPFLSYTPGSRWHLDVPPCDGLVRPLSLPLSSSVYYSGISLTSIGEKPRVDPVLHAFFLDHLITDWRLTYQEADRLASWVLQYSAIYEVDPVVQMARILKESSGRHYRLASRGKSRGVVRGRAGEIGFSQIAPFWIGKTVEGVSFNRDMLYDPEGNILAGIALYKRYERVSDNYLMALTRYNSPGSRRPNSYARAVDRIIQRMRREFHQFRLLQPAVYSWRFTSP